MEQEKILHVTTAVKGRERQVQKTIEKPREDSGTYKVSCPFQIVESAPTTRSIRPFLTFKFATIVS